MHCYLRRNTLLLVLLPAMAFALYCEPAEAFWRFRRARCCSNVATARTAEFIDLSIQNPSTKELRGIAEIRRLTARINRNPRDLEALIDRGAALVGLFYLSNNERFLSPAFNDLSTALRANRRSVLAWEGLAYVYMSRKDHAAAIKALDRVISLDGKTFFRAVNRAIAHWRLDEKDKALADYADAIALNGNDAEVRLQRGRLLCALKKYDLAIEDFSKAIELDPYSQTQRSYRASAYFSIDEIDKAVDDIWAAIRLNPLDVGNDYEPSTTKTLTPEALAHGEAQLRKMLHDRPVMAAHIAEGDELWTWVVRKFAGEDQGILIDWDPDDADGPFDASSRLPDKAEHAGIRVRSTSPESQKPLDFEELWTAAVFELHNCGAASEFDRVTKLWEIEKLSRDEFILGYEDVEEHSAQRTRAFFLKLYIPWAHKHHLKGSPTNWYVGQFWRDRDEYVAAMKTDLHWAYYGANYDLAQGWREYEQKNYDRARKLFNDVCASAAVTQPDIVSARSGLADIAWMKDDLDVALTEWEKAIAIDPQADLIFWRAKCLYFQNKFDQAIEGFSQVLESPNGLTADTLAKVYSWRGCCELALQKNRESIADFDQSILADSSEPYPHAARGEAKYWIADYDGAIVDFTEAVRLDPEYAFAFRMRGDAHAAKKEWDLALADLSQSIQLNQSAPGAYVRRGWLNMRAEKYAEALADYRKAVALAPENAKYQNALAWLLCTCAEGSIRDGKQAVALATKACERTKWKSCQIVDTLACALAEVGRFGDAVERMNLAIRLDESADAEIKEALARHLKSFQNRQPYRAKPGE